MAMIELVVRHDGRNWTVQNAELSAEAATLEALDDRLRQIIRNREYAAEGRRVDVFMAFDHSTLPQWMHQYSQHYFNRILVVEI